MKIRNVAAVTAAISGVSFLAYKKYTTDLFKKAFNRRDKDVEVDQKYLDWLNSSNAVQVKINSFDGLKLNAYNIHNNDTNRYIIMVHGIANNKRYMLPYAYEMSNRGYNCLLIDQRACGESEGDYYTYGMKESLDLLVWINYLKSKDENVKISLFGLSMGAATVMMATANHIEEYVSCIVEDCGYSTMKDEFDYVLRKEYGPYSVKIILMMLEKMMNDRFGFCFADIEPKTCLNNNEIPIMFIHGTADDYVPYDMAKVLYNHNKGIKKYYAVEDAGHTKARLDPDYYDNIDTFIKEYM